MNIKKIAFGAAATALMFGSLAIPAFADNTVGQIFSSATPGTVGPTISGVIYGNTSNPSGNGNGVLPSYSPGPWVCGSTTNCAGPTNPGGSMGDFLAPVASNGQATPDFANDTNPNIDFSLH